MSNEHTPGRLRHKARDLVVHGRPVRGALIINVRRGSTTIVAELTGRLSESNARRLVACWNYFEKLGWTTEEIELNEHPVYSSRKLEEQNAELLKALMLAEAALSDIGDAVRVPWDDVAWCEARAADAIPAARAAIAKAEGGAA